MKKTLLSLFCALALVTGLLPSAAALEGEALRAADTLASLGLIQSAEAAADYRLDDPVSRAQAAMLLVRLAGDEAAAKSANVVRYRDTDPWSCLLYTSMASSVSPAPVTRRTPPTVLASIRVSL